MAVVPINFENESLLLVIIERENLDRMKQGDPITIESLRRGGKIMPGVQHPESLSLMIAYEEDDVELYRLVRAGDVRALIGYIERGRKFDPKTDGPANLTAYKGL